MNICIDIRSFEDMSLTLTYLQSSNFPTTQVSLCLMNTRSVRNKTTDILNYIHEHYLDIVVLSENWLSNKDPDLPLIRDKILRHLATD